MSQREAGRGGHVVIAPDKFKGSLTAPDVARHIAIGLRRQVPGLVVRLAPVADGGDGTLEAVLACGFSRVPVVVGGPTGQRLDAAIAVRGSTAVVELAEASGVRRLPAGRLDAMNAGSRGTGELIRAALDEGCTEIVVGVGGSACTDGGAGMLQALGAGLLDARGDQIGFGGAGLEALQVVDLDGLDLRLEDVRITLASDVDNPLLGPTGAAAVYAPQKGASTLEVARLEKGLRRWADLLAETTGHDMSARPGAGAAGGVGFAALAALGADLKPGIRLILELIGFAGLLSGARLVITGEGSLDRQSLHGKAPVGVASAAAEHELIAIAVAGRSTLTDSELEVARLRAVYTLSSIEPDVDVCIKDAGRLLEDLTAMVVAPAWLSG